MEVHLEADSSPEPDAVLMEPSAYVAEFPVAAMLVEATGAQTSTEADMELTKVDAACMAAQSGLSPADSAAAWHAAAEREQRHSEGSWQPPGSTETATEHTPQRAEDCIQPAEALPAHVLLTPCEHASPGAEASTEGAEPCHNPEVALTEHVMGASADSGADILTQVQGAASLDGMTLRDAQAGFEA